MSDTAQTEWSKKTFANEERLPRVPLPTLEESAERFLEWCVPLLTAEQLAETKLAVDEMLQPTSTARTLHSALEEYDKTPGVHSWLDEFWPTRYLGRRDRIALNANFFFLFKDTAQDQVTRAADLIAGAVDYKVLLDTEDLPPAIMRGQALSMEQNKYLFSETRIPGERQDTVRMQYPSTARHIAVFYKGHIFSLDVLSIEAQPYSRTDLQAALAVIMSGVTTPVATNEAVGHLTTKARAEWAHTRQTLLADNQAAIDAIETALFCVCLEDIAPENPKQASDQLLHGNSANRWFDKSISLIVFANGQAGINIEHCGLDGTTILNFVDAIVTATPEGRIEAPSATPAAKEVTFMLSDTVKAEIQAAGDDFKQYATGVATETVLFEDFGSNNAKALGMSPDAFAQMAYQLAHQRTKGMIGATYESIATRHFNHGRTEAMRVVTPEILEFVKTIEDPQADKAAKQTAFRAAAEKHVARAKQAQMGKAPEQHLWELQLLQNRRGQELGATDTMSLYDSPGWLIMRDDYLSTSSAPSVNVQYFGFGSTSTHCIGIGYVMLPDHWNIYLSTAQEVAGDMHDFAENLRFAVQELAELAGIQ